MKITVNGDTKDEARNSVTVLDLLKVCDVQMPDMVSVQLNGAFVDKSKYGSAMVTDGDEVDFLYFMGGGAR